MQLEDCIKGFIQGISKAIPPAKTCKIVLKKMKNIDPPILKGYFEVPRPSKIPQYRVLSTDYYQQVTRNFFLVPANQGTNGKGHSKEQALASGLMELVERYSCSKYILDNRNVCSVYSFQDLKKSNLFQLEDIYANLINKDQMRVLKEEALGSSKIRWYGGYALNGRKVSLPIDLILRLLEGTNGMASGNSLEEALLHGICEVIERHCLSLIEINKLKTPLIKFSTIASSIGKKLIKDFQSLNYPIFIKDFSLGIGLPIIGVVRKMDESSCIVTAGVATTREEALIRALTENSQVENKKNYRKIYLSKYYFANDKVISMNDILDVSHKNMRLELENIEGILNKQNMKIFFIDATDKALKIPSVIVYISGAKRFPLNLDISNQNILKLLIGVSLDLENYEDLEIYLKKAVKNNHVDKLEYSYLRGIILKRRSQHKKAIRYFSRVVKAKLNEPLSALKTDERVNSFVNLGLCYQAINDKASAIEYYFKALDLSPGFNIEEFKWYYDNIPSLFKNRALFNDASNLYQETRLLRMHFPGITLKNLKRYLI